MILDEDGWQRADSPVGDGVWWPAGYPSLLRRDPRRRAPELFNSGEGGETVTCDVAASTARRERILM